MPKREVILLQTSGVTTSGSSAIDTATNTIACSFAWAVVVWCCCVYDICAVSGENRITMGLSTAVVAVLLALTGI